MLAHLYTDQALTLDALGNPKRALELVEQALVIQCELFGERHPDTANSLHNIAAYELALGRTALAYAHAQTAYEIEKQVLGPDHPRTLGTARLLGQIK